MDKLVESVTTKQFSEEVIKAKEEYSSRVEGIFEDDKSFENRMVSFMEWYCFDRKSEKYQKLPLRYFIDTNTSTWSKRVFKKYSFGLLYKEIQKKLRSL